MTKYLSELPDADARNRILRCWIVFFAGVGVVGGGAAVVAAVVVVGGVAAAVVASILPTLGLIRAVNLSNSAPAVVVLVAAAVIAVAMLLNNPGATQLGVTALVFVPVVAGEAVRWGRRQIAG